MGSKLKKIGQQRGAGAVQRGSVVDIKNDRQFQTVVLEASTPVAVDFWAPWCQPCKMMAPVFEAAARDWKGQVRFVKVNTEATPSLARAFHISSIPSLIVFDRGEVADMRIGVTPKHQLDGMLRRTLDKHNGVGLVDKLKRWMGKEDSTGQETEEPAPPEA